jgi:hypothetical protein
MLFAWNRFTKCEEKRTRSRKSLDGSRQENQGGQAAVDIQFSKHGGPVGDNYRSFIDEVVTYTRKRDPIIGLKSWKNVREVVRNAIATNVLVITDFAFQYNSNKN